MDGRQPVIIDTSTLINFLVVDRVSLLTENPRYRFIVTEHARAEVTGHYPEQLVLLDAAIDSKGLTESPVVAIEELELFADLAVSKQLGQGECASIAAAACRDCALAIDDKLAAKKARAIARSLSIIDTQAIVLALIQDNMLDVSTADGLKDRWATEFRFVLKIKSFADLVEPTRPNPP
jgi:predicted nucleic acid-binding protein